MSYNIDSWKTFELADLVIPIGAAEEFFADELGYGKPPRVHIDISERDGIIGQLEGDHIKVQKVNISGHGSGWAMEHLVAMLAKSTGRLVAFLTWEGGDSFSLFAAIDGKVTNENIEIEDLAKAYLASLKTKD